LLTSKEVLEKTGISRATLNNYIGCGIVPKPQVLPPEPRDGAAPRIGYFPEEIVRRIADIQRLKSEGWSMAKITEHFSAGQTAPAAVEPAAATRTAAASGAPAQGAVPKLSIEELDHPAYLVNHSFEMVWSNAAARAGVLGNLAHLPPEGESTNVFSYLLRSRPAGTGVDSREQILRFHLGLAKERGANLLDLCREVPRDQVGALERLYNEADRPKFGLVSHTYLSTVEPGAAQRVCLYAVQFREGTLFVYVPGSSQAHRDLVIGDLVRKRLPVLTHVAVLVTDLQNSTRIWSELPPEEYFELINQIWLAVDPIFRRHHGTQGKHAEDGMVCYFFPQPDSDYVWNALVAAQEMREAMRQVSKEWQSRKGWTTELYLNTGLNEGQEWLGAFQSPSRTEFTVLGDTINHAARMSDFARSGAVWATKNLIGKLTGEERRRLKYGVRRKNSDGQDIFVSSVFSDVEGLTDPTTSRSESLTDIARLPITEIVDIATPDPRTDRAVGHNPT
jgi:adenylate cyclase